MVQERGGEERFDICIRARRETFLIVRLSLFLLISVDLNWVVFALR